MVMIPLELSFYQQDTLTVAQSLIGLILQTNINGQITSGRIVETEAYLQNDPAAHSFIGPTARNQALFGPTGTIYVYLIYGLHYCFNVVTNQVGTGEAVLIRALEPLAGLDTMQQRRGLTDPKQLCNGPAKLAQALGITPSLNSQSLIDGSVTILKPTNSPLFEIQTTTRIGITKAADLPYRFYLKNSPFISHK